jgi:probable F420-dependent oxidoreductase
MTGTLGVSLGLWQDRDPLEALATAALADELGYDELWVGEMATFDAFALATAIARQTDRIPLCVGPLATAVRDPMMIAMGAASVAALGGGRTVSVALGSSSDVVVGDWHGRERTATATHLAQSVQALRPLLAGDRGSYDGSLVRTQGYRLRLPPPSSTLTMAAFGPAAVRAAARHADRMVLNLVTPGLVSSLSAALSDAAADAGRPRPRLAVWIAAAVDPTDATLDQLRTAVAGYLAAPGYGEMFAAAGFGDLVAFARERPHPRELLARVPVELIRAVGAIGDPAVARDRIAKYRAAGVDDVVLVPATAGDDGGERTLRALAGA